ncbi:MAG: fasciclin domain-containing protein [Saprospiraceae bacterium]
MTTPFKNLIGFALLLAIPFSFTSCDDDDVVIMEPVAPTTIVSVASGDDRFETLVASLSGADLDLVGTLSGTGPFTVFAPTDDAFDLVDLSGFDQATVDQALLYHVLGGEVKAANIQDGTVFQLNGNTVGFEGSEAVLVLTKNTDGVFINGATVIEADIEADNGVIHAIDKVLLPPTVVDLAVALPNATSLVSALGAADASSNYDLVNALSGDGPFTVFAPTNDVFMVDPAATADQIGNILSHHVIRGNIRSSDLEDGVGAIRTTLSGDNVQVTRNGAAVTIIDGQGNTFNVTNADIQGANGVIHTIDGVMMP